MREEKKDITLKAYAPNELATIYEVDRRTLNKWLEPYKNEIGERKGRYYTIEQVRIIFSKLSLPGIIPLE